VPPVGANRRGLIDLTAAAADGFWAWAAIETLRHTGIRIEELLELTQLSLRHYTSTTTWANATAPMARRACTSMPALGAGSCASTPPSCPGSRT
jgi:hypothetical protein